MSESPDFAEFLWRIRAGDEDAARELVRRFEPLIRREVRLRIADGRPAWPMMRRGPKNGDFLFWRVRFCAQMAIFGLAEQFMPHLVGPC